MSFNPVPVPTNHLMKTPSSLLSCVRKQKEFLTFCSPEEEICSPERQAEAQRTFYLLSPQSSSWSRKLLRTAGSGDVPQAISPWMRWGWAGNVQGLLWVVYGCTVTMSLGCREDSGMAGEVGTCEVDGMGWTWWDELLLNYRNTEISASSKTQLDEGGQVWALLLALEFRAG